MVIFHSYVGLPEGIKCFPNTYDCFLRGAIPWYHLFKVSLGQGRPISPFWLGLYLYIIVSPFPNAPCIVYLPTKLGDLWGKCWDSYSSTMVRILDCGWFKTSYSIFQHLCKRLQEATSILYKPSIDSPGDHPFISISININVISIRK